ncbi:MAG: methyltransferase domain-containing protein [Pseudomonadota bacterium]
MTTVPKFIACPECHANDWQHLENAEFNAPYNGERALKCGNCGRMYPVVDGIFVMWSDQLRGLLHDGAAGDAMSDKVKRANIEIYNEVSTEYGEHHDGSQPYAQTLLFLKAIADNFRKSKLDTSQSVLVDVGCATGASLDLGAHAYSHTVGVDISLGNLKAAKQRGHTAILADAEKLPFSEAAVDTITCFATLHHFPNPQAFVSAARRCLRSDGIMMIAGEPSQRAMTMGPLAKAAWNARKPVYRFLGRFSDRYYMHRDREQQERNDLAEVNRTAGGFSESQLEQFLAQAGFQDKVVFYGTDPDGFSNYATPPWQQFILRMLSFQNPFKRSNWMNLTAVGRADSSAD